MRRSWFVAYTSYQGFFHTERRLNMSGKRRDNKGRILCTGENQRKNGMYEFCYTDANKKRRSIYDMDLMELRAKEDEIPSKINGLLHHFYYNLNLGGVSM